MFSTSGHVENVSWRKRDPDLWKLFKTLASVLLKVRNRRLAAGTLRGPPVFHEPGPGLPLPDGKPDSRLSAASRVPEIEIPARDYFSSAASPAPAAPRGLF